MYDLSAKEVFFKVAEVRGSRRIVVKHFFRLPTLQDWAEHFKGMSELGMSKGRETFEISDTNQERLVQLWESLVTKVEGYRVGGEDVMVQPDWKERIPLPHKRDAVEGFLKVNRKEEDIVEEAVLDLGSDEIEIFLYVLQNEKELIVQKELGFFFSTPSTSDYKQMNKLSSRMQMVKTKERNVSAIRVPTDIKPYVKLFDKLITKVTGYSYNGEDVMKQPDWRQYIDAFHKRAAVTEVFSSEFMEDEGN